MVKYLTAISLFVFTFSIKAQNDKTILKNGIYENHGNISSYKNGKLHGKQIKEEGYSGKTETSYYNNGEILKKEYNYFLLDKNDKEYPLGTYKNGEPYQGYFPKDLKEILVVDYYENGKKKFQYSKENVFSYKNAILSVKSTYKEDQIYDGVCYELGRKYLIIDHLKKGELIKQVLWVFAVNYANAITIMYNENGFTITEKGELKFKIVRDKNKLSVLLDHKEVITSLQTGNVLKNKDVLFYEENGVLLKKLRDQAQMSPKEYETNIPSMLFDIYVELLYYKNHDINMVTIIKELQNSKDEDVFAEISYNNKGKPYRGILVSQKDKQYIGKVYKDGKLLKTLNNVSKDSLNTAYQKFLLTYLK